MTLEPTRTLRVKLGKAPATHDTRTARLELYSGSLNYPAQLTQNNNLVNPWGMLGNDSHGDCVVADDAHEILLDAKLRAVSVGITDATALAFYGQASLALNHSSADQGLNMLAYLRWRRSNQWPGSIARPILGFGTFDWHNHDVLKALIANFRAVRLGILLPRTAQQQKAPGGVWSIQTRVGDGLPGSWGGHDVPAIGYDASGVHVVTWGGIQYVTWDFLDYYVDEAYCTIPFDPPADFDLGGFISYLRAIGAYEGPDAPPTPTPPPAPAARVVDGIGNHYSDGTTQQIWPVTGPLMHDNDPRATYPWDNGRHF